MIEQVLKLIEELKSTNERNAKLRKFNESLENRGKTKVPPILATKVSTRLKLMNCLDKEIRTSRSKEGHHLKVRNSENLLVIIVVRLDILQMHVGLNRFHLAFNVPLMGIVIVVTGMATQDMSVDLILMRE